MVTLFWLFQVSLLKCTGIRAEETSGWEILLSLRTYNQYKGKENESGQSLLLVPLAVSSLAPGRIPVIKLFKWYLLTAQQTDGLTEWKRGRPSHPQFCKEGPHFTIGKDSMIHTYIHPHIYAHMCISYHIHTYISYIYTCIYVQYIYLFSFTKRNQTLVKSIDLLPENAIILYF